MTRVEATNSARFPAAGTEIPSLDIRQNMAFNARCKENVLGSYNHANDSKYPLRDLVTGEPLYIKHIGPCAAGPEPRPSTKIVEPYISGENGWDVEKYKSLHERLKCEPLTAADIKDEREKELIGQYGVKALGPHRKGDLLGFYGGVLVPKKLVSIYLPFTMGPANVPDVIDGDNIISRINTIFEYDQRGQPIRQAAAGYNCDIAVYPVQVIVPTSNSETHPSLKNTLLYCIFATQDIPSTEAGTELRWNYQLDEEDISIIATTQS